MALQKKELPEMLDMITASKQLLTASMRIPSALLLPQASADTYFEVQEKAREEQKHCDGMLTEFGMGVKVMVSKYLPKQYECVGHEFNNPAPAKNRSLRLWKKLRYGVRGKNVKPILEEVLYAFLFNEEAVLANMQQRIDAMTMASMCGVLTNVSV